MYKDKDQITKKVTNWGCVAEDCGIMCDHRT